MAAADKVRRQGAPSSEVERDGGGERIPSVIADDVHVTYRSFGGRRRALSGEDPSRWRPLGRATKHVGAVTEVEAIRGVSFIAYHGESIGIIGANGSGKSTLLRAIAGLMPISSGAVYTRGEVSLLGVNAALISSLSGERNIMLGGLAQGLSRKAVKRRYKDIVEFSGIGDFVHMPMRAYSSGMAARLRFAISTASAPDILVIDEALSTGDKEFRERSAARIREIREKAGTVFIVSHSARTVRDMCDRAIWIDEGRVRLDGPADEVSAAYEASQPRARKKQQRSSGKQKRD